MEVIASVGQNFFFSLGTGLALFRPLVNAKATGVGFPRLISVVAFCSLFICAILSSLFPLVESKMSLLLWPALTFVGLGYLFQNEKFNLSGKLLYGAALVTLFVFSFYFAAGEKFDWISNLSAVGFIGIVTYAMLLGHWYLVVPKLSERPLLLAVKIIWAFLLIKLCLSLFAVFQVQDLLSEYTQVAAGYAFNWMVLLMRFLWGYVAIFVLNIYTWKLVKMRSIQSATGLLYVMVFFLLIGELIALSFYYQYGIWL